MNDENIPKVVKVSYLYVLRVELSRPYYMGRRMVSRLAMVVHTPRNVQFVKSPAGGVLEFPLLYGGTRRIPEPSFWDIGNGIAIPEAKELSNWMMWAERSVDVDAPDPVIAYWTASEEGGVMLATMNESGEMLYL